MGKITRYFADYASAYNYYGGTEVPSTEIALIGNASYVFVSSDNSYNGGNTQYFDANMTNETIVTTMVESSYVSGHENGYAEGTSYGYNWGEQEGYQTGYTAGVAYGEQTTYPIAYAAGQAYGEQIGYENGYTAGVAYGEQTTYPIAYAAGQAYGEQIGYNNGYNAGEAYGEQIGYNNGYNAGYSYGYSYGYDLGYTDGQSSAPSVSYTLTVTASSPTSGSVTGGGLYTPNTIAVVEAIPYAGYEFDGWYEDMIRVSQNTQYSFTITSNRTLEARFREIVVTYTVNAYVTPPASGSITGTGSYNNGDTCTLVATPSTGYHFVKWQDGAMMEVSIMSTYSFTVTNDVTLYAVFESDTPIGQYTVSAYVGNMGVGGTVSGGGQYNNGDTCTLVATPSMGYHFVRWEDIAKMEISIMSTYNFTVTGDVTLYAIFEEDAPMPPTGDYYIDANVTPAASGSVTGTGSYNNGDTCTLVASPSTGWHFVNWTEAAITQSTNSTYSFTVSGSRTLTANFAEDAPAGDYTISAVVGNMGIGGTVSGGGQYNNGDTCTLVATPYAGYHFDRWEEAAMTQSTNSTYSFTVTGDRYLSAWFEADTPTPPAGEYTVTTDSNPSIGGSTSGGGTYSNGDTCTVTASPSTGYHFVRWEQNAVIVSYNQSYSFNVTGNTNIIAYFEQDSPMPPAGEYTISVLVNNMGGSTTGGGQYSYGATCTLVATPVTGYHFVRWQDGAMMEVSTSSTYSFTVSGNATYTAIFEEDSQATYTISASPNAPVAGTVTGDGQYSYGDTCTLIASEAEGWHFVSWTEAAIPVSSSLSYTFTVTGDRTLVAEFGPNA